MSTSTTTATHVRSGIAAGVAALAFLALATGCGSQSTVTDEPASRPAPQVRPASPPTIGLPPPVRNGTRPDEPAEPDGIVLRRSAPVPRS
jgi:hypothetical protein